jgi:magnesium transporter
VLTTVLSSSELVWKDLVDPSREELEEAAREHGLHRTSLRDCLEPRHLPKHERFEQSSFVILRGYDEQAGVLADSVQALTRKLAIFWGAGFIVTVHRAEQPWIARFKEDCVKEASPLGLEPLLAELMRALVDTYSAPLDAAEETVDQLEEALFEPAMADPSLKEIHLLKRRVGLMRRMLWQGLAVVREIRPEPESAPFFQDLREKAEAQHFAADEVIEQINALLATQLALASHRTNEVMRILTVFAAFFLPLTFIVGIYGMNFEHMPEIESRFGYPLVLAGMAAVCGVIFAWFRRRGWLRGQDRSNQILRHPR